MARMYSRKKGRSGSKKPMEKIAPWVSYNKKEVDEIILKLAKDGLQSSQIGLVLRDKYGIPSIRNLTQKRVTKVMKEANIYPKFPEDLLNLFKRSVNLQDHLKENKKDYTSKRGLELTVSKIRRLGKYYKSRKILPADWKYDAQKARLLIK